MSVALGYIGVMRRGAKGTRKHVVATSAVFSVYDGISKIPANKIFKDGFAFLRKSKIMRNSPQFQCPYVCPGLSTRKTQ